MNKNIQILSFVFACVVVFFHASYGSAPLYTKVWAISAQNIAVPFFFVTSGYFFMKRYDGTLNWWCEQVKKRVRTLVVPYVIWCGAFSILCHGLQVKSLLADMGLVGVCPLLGYVKFLFLAAVLTPALIWIVGKVQCLKLEILVLAVILLLFLVPLPLKTSALQTLVWFSMGLCIARKSYKLSYLRWGVICIFCVVGLWFGVDSMRYWIPFFALPLIWYLVTRLPSCNLFCRLGELSFFVYCFHTFVLAELRQSDYLGAFPTGVIAVLASLCVGQGMRAFVPNFYKILSGGR